MNENQVFKSKSGVTGVPGRYLSPRGDLIGRLVHHAQRLEGKHAQLALAHGGLQGKEEQSQPSGPPPTPRGMVSHLTLGKGKS